MSEIAVLAVRGLAGGTLVVLFALLGEAARPKSFSGLFSAAPSVALAGLVVTVGTKGTIDAGSSSLGMIVGSVAMLTYCLAAMLLLPRVRAVGGSIGAWLIWLAVALGLAWLVL